MLARAATIATLVSYALALGLSDQCTRALSGIATSPDAAACLSPSSLVSVFLGSSNTSVVDPINGWLTSLCSSPACSNDTLAAIVTNATTGCAMELSALGFNAAESGAKEQITVAVQTYYPTLRKVICLKDGDTNCVTQTLKNLESIIGPLSVDNVIQVVGKGFNFSAIPENMTCTNCIKEAYNVIKQDFPMLDDPETTQAIQGQCSADFTDGKTPAGISQSATTNTEVKQDSGSVAFTSSSLMSASALVVISGIFAALL
ncbi:hypothetical protein BDZ94DRAFT_1257666 [Collybia nuda]|uniref:Secreted protein n=1 Tax=Collybia nuda TaxID=64659 RepID=A0A9P5Y5E5_9AGAR|nr:hypothetical protein BDZ94DRAFT_1257666 [Collybia nuda]